MTENRSFLGKGWAFPPRFDKSAGGTIMVAEAQDIRESLFILLSTLPGERPLQPSYGCGLHALVFDNLSRNRLSELEDAVDRAVLFFEPRIILNSIDIDTDAQYEGVLYIRLNYTIRSTNSRSNMVYPFYFREGTQIP